MGWRPTEVALLQKVNVTKTHIELMPVQEERLGTWHAKTGRRVVQIHSDVEAVVKRRMKQSKSRLLFPFVRKKTERGKLHRRRTTAKGLLEEAWDPSVLSKQYVSKLRSAAKAAKIKKKVDSRILRRTFGSLALRAGITVEALATVMGNRPAIIRKHYARLLPNEVSLNGIAFAAGGDDE